MQYMLQIVSLWCTSLSRIILGIFVYCLYRDCYTFFDTYLNNVQLNNIYITPYFEHLDARRKTSTGKSLMPLTKYEIKYIFVICSINYL
jgi:hypothetical protein